MRHSTAMEWSDLETKIKKRSRLKHSTGEHAAIRHACGVELDLKAEDIEDAIEAKKREIIEKELLKKQKAFQENMETGNDSKDATKKVSFEY